MTIRHRFLQIVTSGILLGGAWSAGAAAQEPAITKVAIAPVSTALGGSYVISRFWNASGAVTIVSAGAEPQPGVAGQRIAAIVSQGMVLSNGRGGSFQIPGGAQVTARYVRTPVWKTLTHCVVFDSIEVGGKTVPVNGLGGCLPTGSWNLSAGNALAWIVPDAGPEAFPENAPSPAATDATKAASS